MAETHQSEELFELVRKSERSTILLPNFQRDFIWRQEAQANMAASILLGIPSGSLLLVSGRQDQFDCREIGGRHSLDVAGDPQPCEFLLDGQQRLTTLRQVFGDPFASDWRQTHGKTFANLRIRWSLQVRPNEDEDADLFQHRHLAFSEIQMEPELVVEALNRHPIYKTKGLDHWSHPEFEKTLGPAERSTRIASEAALDGSVPLWGILESPHELTERSLKEIARSQYELLAGQLQDGTLDEHLEKELAGRTGVSHPNYEQLKEELQNMRADWVARVLQAISSVRSYRLPTVRLAEDELQKAIVIFEAINRGGTPLTPFDLVSARYAKGRAGSQSLPAQIAQAIEAFEKLVPVELSTNKIWSKWEPSQGLMLKDLELTKMFKTSFMQTLGASTVDRSLVVDDLKQSRYLRLQPDQIASSWEQATTSVVSAWRFLQVRCGIPKEGALRNKLVLLPIALVLADPQIENSAKTFDRLEYWYWSSVLTDSYATRQNDQCVRDIEKLRNWLRPGGDNPFEARAKRVLNDRRYSDKDTLLRDGEDEIPVGTDVDLYLLQLVTALGGRDLLDRERINVASNELEDHHLVPLGSAATVGESTKDIRRGKKELHRVLNSPLNRAYVLKPTNRKIAAKPLEKYISEVDEQARSSLFLPLDSFDKQPGEADLEWIRGILGQRYESIRSAVIKRLDDLA